MFYSQFILAKKGPLGTIWIAAHLERKLRKNQVADTDIGVSVDSILSPDVPIALRLSSHLLLGVVRIYSRKVNYLFDDCSEALLKVKQAFRSTVVDLPPEESKAPYHSITLPETFDLDDFELPDTEVFQGNFVDHHVSTKEQITLQDTMDGVIYSTSQFGLDERFGDGDASQIALDLDEELLLNKGVPSGHGVLLTSSVDPQLSVDPSSSQKADELDVEMHDLSQAVATDCCMEGDELDEEMHNPSQAVATDCCTEVCNQDIENLGSLGESELNGPSQAVATDCCTEVCNQDIENLGSLGKSELNGGLEKLGSQVRSPSTAQPMELIVSPNIADISGTDEVFESSKDLNPEVDSNGSLGKSELNVGLDVNNSGECGAAKENGLNECLVSLDSSDKSPPLSEQADHHLDKSPVNGFCSVSENPSFVDQSSLEPAINAQDKLDVNSNAENKDGQELLSPEASEVANVVAEKNMLSACMPILQPCNFLNNQENAEIDNLVSMPTHFGVDSEEMSGMQDATDVSVAKVQDVTNQSLKEDQFRTVDHCNNLNGQSLISENTQSEKENDSVAPELPSPERMLSLPDVPVSQPTELLIGSTPERDVLAQGDQDATINKITGKKRSLTESTITLQSQNSVESSEAAQSKRSANIVPDDDDLLSSILVGRRSTVLKVKSTPPAFDLVSSKRRRVTPRSGALKRKVLVDDSMVLHGDTIRQQLVSTEDIRRVRKKAPSTHPEIWILQKQFLEDEMFNEPIFTGMSSKLISLHCQPFDVSETKLVQDDESKAQSTANDTVLSPKRLVVGDEAELEGTSVPPVARDDGVQQFADCPNDTPVQQSVEVSNDLFRTALENEKITNSEVGPTPSQFDISENRTEIETQFDTSENRTEMETLFGISENRTEMETQFDTSENRSEMKTQFDTSENRTEAETECRREPVDDEKDGSVAFGIESSSCLPCASENNADLINGDMIRSFPFKDTNGADYSEQVDGSCLKLDEDISGKDALLTVDNNVEVIDFGEGVDKAAFGEIVEHRSGEGYLEVGLEDTDSVVPMTDGQPEYSLPVNGENMVTEDRTSDEGRTHESGTVNKDDEFHESDLKYDEQREDSKVDPLDPVEDVFDHDTDFLNFDDEEVAEDVENSIPNAGGSQILDNSGWSTRTRAVANYLQVLFHKEAQHGRTVLHLDNLLANKSRKEASRMFFETLVLKTRDYIHVDEEIPFGNISIKPRARLLKSEF